MERIKIVRRLIWVGFLMWVSLFLISCAGTTRPYAAYIEITSNPSGAHVTNSEGQYLGTTPIERSFKSWNDRWGRPFQETYTFELEGYESQTKTINWALGSDNRYRVHVNLEEYIPETYTAPSSFTIQHTITTDPTGAAVYLNMDYMGNTPLTINLDWYSYSDRAELRLEKYGFQTNRRMITANDKRIHVVMQ